MHDPDGAVLKVPHAHLTCLVCAKRRCEGIYVHWASILALPCPSACQAAGWCDHILTRTAHKKVPRSARKQSRDSAHNNHAVILRCAKTKELRHHIALRELVFDKPKLPSSITPLEYALIDSMSPRPLAGVRLCLVEP